MKTLLTLPGTQIETIEAKPFGDSSVALEEGAFERIDLILSDGRTISLSSGSYCIPEEACIYVEETT